MDALFTAASLSDLSANVGTLLVAFIAVLLLFVGYRYIIKAALREGGSYSSDGFSSDADLFERYEATQGRHYDEQGNFHQSGWYGRSL